MLKYLWINAYDIWDWVQIIGERGHTSVVMDGTRLATSQLTIEIEW